MTLSQWLELIAKWVNVCRELDMDPDTTTLHLYGEDGAIYRAEMEYGSGYNHRTIDLHISSNR